MKKNRLAGAGLALALAIGSVAAAGPALAADIWVEGDITTTETNPYSAGWFIGNSTPPSTPPTGSDAGLNIIGQTQILYGGEIAIESGAQLGALLDGAGLTTDQGAAFFQIPMFWNAASEADKAFTTLRPTAPGTPGSTWVTSRAFAGFAANEEIPAADLIEFADAAITEGQWTPTVLAFGVFVNSGVEARLLDVTFNGNTYHFTKQPAAPAVPVQKPATFTG